MVYVALLRGINVGGKTRVEMPRLKTVFENTGCEQLSTYINSGNVIFSDSRSAKKLTPVLEAAIKAEFGFAVPVVLRDEPAITELCQSIPAEWVNDAQQKTDVLFLWDEVNDKSVANKVSYKPEIENVLFLNGALVWNIDRKNATRGSSIKLIKTDLYKFMTIRNINTVRKLKTLMEMVR